MAYETAHSRPSNVPMATGAKRSVVLGKITPNGAPHNGGSHAGGNGSAIGTPATSGMGNGMNSAAHKAKAPRPSKVTRQPVPAKAKAATR
jgi:hypothetical protein